MAVKLMERKPVAQYVFRPELLTHPNIPKPLHGLNPRSLLGKEWWDVHRQEAYAKYDYHCWACGTHKSQAEIHQWLEGHESYEYDYKVGSATLKEIVALCYSCHNFIHSGWLFMQAKSGKIDRPTAAHIIDRGIGICEHHKLVPFRATYMIRELLWGTYPVDVDRMIAGKGYVPPDAEDYGVRWKDWHLVIDGKRYYSNFANYDEWDAFYRGEDR
jgi:hypothetical protein